MKNERLIVWGAVAIMIMIPILTFFMIKADAITLILNNERYSPKKPTLVIIPIMTANAYKNGGFYDYYSGRCGKECLNVDISQSIPLGEAGSENTWRTLERAGYAGMNDYILDYYLQSDPNFLLQYKTVIVLHSEYVTQHIFDALQAHPNVVYLAPNSNYALVKLDKFHMSLVSGHTYGGKDNSFGWQYENTFYEQDKACDDWQFEKIPNGYELNCNPEIIINHNFALLQQLREL